MRYTDLIDDDKARFVQMVKVMGGKYNLQISSKEAEEWLINNGEFILDRENGVMTSKCKINLLEWVQRK